MILPTVGLAIALPVVCFATTWEVPGNAATIQGGIDLAAPGDTVLVHPGTYTGVGNGGLDFHGKDLVLRSVGGAEVTIIDCEAAALPNRRGFHLHSGETAAAVVEGFTVENGYRMGGGALFEGSSPTVTDCMFVGAVDKTLSAGLGIYLDASSPTIERCIIQDNGYAGSGGGMFCANGSFPVIDRCVFARNSACGGSAIEMSESSATVTNCTFWNNAANEGTISCGSNSSVVLENCIMAFNSGSLGPVLCSGGSSATLLCCDVYGNGGGDWVRCIAGQDSINGNISEDPLFCNPGGGCFALQEGSPCAPFSPPNEECALIGAWPVGCEATSVERTTWGRLKAMYR
jgi:hypothetical protein